MQNPYQTLGIKPEAEEAEIKKAFRSKARHRHPDAGGSAEEFKELSEAYEILSNPERRKRFDESGQTFELPNLEKEVHEKIRFMIVMALEQADYETDDLFAELKKSVDFQISKIRSEEYTHAQRKARFSKSAKKISRKDGERNIAVEALKDQIALAHSRIEKCRKNLEVMKAILAELGKYHWAYDKSEHGRTVFADEMFSKFTLNFTTK
jgi:curved DNA-binding protein CbpA